ncbi:MAG: LCP family protein [Lachnospiraceae bacterium]|nr:LCP family protein [Lachnospiraceae bacterium]
MSRNNKKKRRKGRFSILIFIIEMLVLLVLFSGVFVYAKVNDGLRQMGSVSRNNQFVVTNDATPSSSAGSDTKEVNSKPVITEVEEDPNLNTDNVIINEEAAVNKVMSGYTNILLLGIDARSESEYNYSNSDTMIICSINNDNGEVRLASIYRDTLLNTNPANPKYNKANDAYCQGSIAQCLSMINTNLDLSITQYMIVNFDALSTLVDDLDGIEITLSEQEIGHLNNYCQETSKVTGKSYEPLPQVAGTYNLNGVQAVSYSRIRYTNGYDMKRTQRQRLVIKKITEKARTKGLAAVDDVIADVFPLCKTNISNSMLIKMAAQMIGYYAIVDTTGFPFTFKSGSSGVNPECLVPVTLCHNVQELHAFLFNENDYQPSQTVMEYDAVMQEKSGFTEADIATATSSSDVPAAASEADTIR